MPAKEVAVLRLDELCRGGAPALTPQAHRQHGRTLPQRPITPPYRDPAPTPAETPREVYFFSA
jgi:hypothetical protein